MQLKQLSKQLKTAQYSSMQLNTAQNSSVQFNTAQYSSMHVEKSLNTLMFWTVCALRWIPKTQYSSMQLNAIQYSSMQVHTTQYTSIQLNAFWKIIEYVYVLHSARSTMNPNTQ